MRKLCILPMIIALLISGNASAFDNLETHRRLTEKAIESSDVNQYFIDNLDLPNGTEASLNGWTIKKWLSEGSRLEDEPLCRASNHFHNPLRDWTESGMRDQPGIIDWWCSESEYPQDNIKSAVHWATGYTAPAGGSNDPTGNQWDWDHAREFYYIYLTGKDSQGSAVASTEDEREIYFAKCLQALGQVLHLIQDMAVPAHVRDDFKSHLDWVGITWGTFFKPLKWVADKFAYFVERHKEWIAGSEGGDLTDKTLTKFWDTNNYIGQDPDLLNSQMISLAEYTNMNFTSGNTIFAEDFLTDSDSKNDVYYHPYPRKSSTNVQEYINGDLLPETVIGEDNVPDKIPYIKKTGDGVKLDHFVKPTYFTKEIQQEPDYDERVFNRTFKIDRTCAEEYASKLLPRAVGYSAGLLDYFFRGRLDVEFVDEGLKITNKSEETMHDGNFELYYDNEEGSRQQIEISSGAEVSEQYALQPNEDRTITFDPPSDFGEDKHYILVYRGGLANETDAVVGKVVVGGVGNVYVAVGHSGYTERCIVWDAKENDYAELTNPITGSLMSFPCDREDIQWWLDRTNSVSNGALFSFVQAGEDAIGCENCSEMSANTGCGVQINTDTTVVVSEGTEYWISLTVDRTTHLSAIRNYLLRSWNGAIRNAVGGTTCIRTILDYLFASTESWGVPGHEGEGGCTRTKTWTRQTITPLGNLFALALQETEYVSVHVPESGGTRERNVTNQIIAQWGTWGNAYSDRVMVQIYVDHVIIRDTIGADGTLGCAYWGGCNPGPFQETSRSRVTGIKAACDLYDDANVVDPRMQNANAAFTSAVDGLIADFYEVNGIAGDMLWPVNTQVDVDIRR